MLTHSYCVLVLPSVSAITIFETVLPALLCPWFPIVQRPFNAIK